MYHSSHLKNIVDQCNGKTTNFGEKHFQTSLLSGQGFGVHCPITGDPINPKCNYVFPNNAVIYYFENPEKFVLVSSHLSFGNPIIAALNETSYHQAYSKIKLQPKIEQKVSEIINTPLDDYEEINWLSRPRLICGHINFAHFMWNEFSTLYEIIKQEKEVDIFLVHDPFDLCKDEKFSNHISLIENIHDVRGWSCHPIVLGTSSYLDAATKSHLITHIMGSSSTTLPKDGPQKLYITVRPDGRTLQNQEYFITTLIQSFHQKYPDLEFVLDGFSLPDDFNRTVYDHMRQNFLDRINKSNELIQNIIKNSNVNNIHFNNITGYKFSDSLKIISLCQYYISHAGTLQHKIGWFFKRHGFMHSNQTSAKRAAVKWIAEQVADAIAPNVLNENNIEDLEVRGMPVINERNRDYKIHNIDSVIDHIITQYEKYI